MTICSKPTSLQIPKGRSAYSSFPAILVIFTATTTYCHTCPAIEKRGTGGSFALVRCSWSSKLTMLIKLANEKTVMEREVSLRIARRGCVTW